MNIHRIINNKWKNVWHTIKITVQDGYIRRDIPIDLSSIRAIKTIELASWKIKTASLQINLNSNSSRNT